MPDPVLLHFVRMESYRAYGIRNQLFAYRQISGKKPRRSAWQGASG
jgi:hypothetical protein